MHSYHRTIALLVAASVLVMAAASASSSCTQVLVTTSTPGPCVDDADFEDSNSGLGCIDCDGFVPNGCWTDLSQFGFPEFVIIDFLNNCPAICGLCGGGATEVMSVELYDYSTDGPPALPSDSTFTEVGPRFDDPPSAAVTQTICLSTPSCFKIRIAAPSLFDYVFRSSYEVKRDSDGTVIISAEGLAAGGWNSFCLADCPIGTAYDVESRTCLDCTKGVVNDVGYCVPCEAGTFRESGSEDSPARCSTCPVPTFLSLEGATSVSECFSVDANVYLTNQIQRVVAYDPTRSHIPMWWQTTETCERHGTSRSSHPSCSSSLTMTTTTSQIVSRYTMSTAASSSSST